MDFFSILNTSKKGTKHPSENAHEVGSTKLPLLLTAMCLDTQGLLLSSLLNSSLSQASTVHKFRQQPKVQSTYLRELAVVARKIVVLLDAANKHIDQRQTISDGIL